MTFCMAVDTLAKAKLLNFEIFNTDTVINNTILNL